MKKYIEEFVKAMPYILLYLALFLLVMFANHLVIEALFDLASLGISYTVLAIFIGLIGIVFQAFVFYLIVRWWWDK